MRRPVVNVVTNGPVRRVCPELDERMRVRAFGSSPVIGRQDQETQQRHAPEEAEPGCEARFVGSGSHVSSRCFLLVDLVTRGRCDIAVRSIRGPECQPPAKGTTGVRAISVPSALS